MGSWRPAETGAEVAPVPTEKPEGKEEPRDLLLARYLFEAADYVGRVSVAVQDTAPRPSAPERGERGGKLHPRRADSW